VKGGFVRKTVLAAAIAALAITQVAVAAPLRSTVEASPAAAPKKQPVTLGFFRGQTVRYFDFGPIKLKPGNKLAPIWTFTNGADRQRNIIDTVPGRRSYSPLWRVNKVTWKEGVTPRRLTSAAAVKAAEEAGEITIARTATVVNCPVLGFSQKRHPGFSRGKTIRYYDLGPVKVAPGNEVIPLWTVKNGVDGQLNIADVRPGQTAYPPLWAIVEVTWKAGAQKRLLKSLAQVKRAQAAGEVTLKKTSLVVNCPLV
jgi:hypothetical protein